LKWVIKYLLLVLLLLVISNYVYVFTGLYERDVKICNGELIYRIDTLSEKKAILFFSESSNFTTSKKDSSTESISDIVSRIRGRNDLEAINQAASHAGTYKIMLQRIKGKKTKTVVIPVNMRSFGYNFIEADLETNLSRTNIIYTEYPPIVKKFMLAFKIYDNKENFKRRRIIAWHYKHDILFSDLKKFQTVKKWDAFMFSQGHLKSNGERDPEKCALACHFIKNYAFVIDQENKRIKDLDAICDFCKRNHITVIFDLLPENLELAKKLCGNDLIYLMDKNRIFLKERYSSKTLFIDNLDILPDSIFIDRQWPTEHYTYEGRKKIAITIAKELQ
jgi:hypothetical protein